MNHRLPKALLLDLDDTILNDSGHVDDCWKEACCSNASGIDGLDADKLLTVVDRTRHWYWADAERHRRGRLDLDAARQEIVRMALVEMGVDNDQLAASIARRYRDLRDARIHPFPDAIDTLRWLRQCGCRLALLTNGSAVDQRKKVSRFELEGLFDLILIEGEVGFGKPDPRIYSLALHELLVAASDAWIVGDNLEWEIAQPQKMGLFTVWVDVRGTGLPASTTVRPNRIIRTLSDLRVERDCSPAS